MRLGHQKGGGRGASPPFQLYHFCLHDNSSITWWNFTKLGQEVKLDGKINWLDFEWDWVTERGGGRGGLLPPFQLYHFRLRNNSSITWWNFTKLGQKVKLDGTINWLDFEWDWVTGRGGGGGLLPLFNYIIFVYVITQVLLHEISPNLVRRSSWMGQLTD